MLHFIGLGLSGCDDITVKGLNLIKNAKHVYLEAYTSILTVGKESLEEFYGREIILTDRNKVEQDSDEARETEVCFLVVGDPFGATTHTDLILRAVEKNIKYSVVHNASIINAIGCCGLQLYSYGETVSIVFWNDNWKPESFYDKIISNRKRNLHTLCLLDIKVKEQTVENMMRGKEIYEPPRYMSAVLAAQQLLEIVSNRRKLDDQLALDIDEDTVCVALARVGAEDQKIHSTTLKKMSELDESVLGSPLHSLIIASPHLHIIEADMLRIHGLQTATAHS